MRFIELHRKSDGRASIINLDEIAEIRLSADSGKAVVEFRGTDIMPMPGRESYKEVRASMIAAKALVI